MNEEIIFIVCGFIMGLLLGFILGGFFATRSQNGFIKEVYKTGYQNGYNDVKCVYLSFSNELNTGRIEGNCSYDGCNWCCGDFCTLRYCYYKVGEKP